MLRVDLSIDCDSTEYWLFLPYVVAMVIVFPIGVPVVYTSIFVKYRFLLARMRQYELAYQSSVQEIARDTKAIAHSEIESEDEARMREVIRQHEMYRDLMEKRMSVLHGKMPATLRKLTAGYEVRHLELSL